MVTFEVNDMTCGHCVSVITKAVAFVDPGAEVQVDLASHRVQIDPTELSVEVYTDAIKLAGYTPVVVEGATATTVKTTPRKGCCCG